MKLLIVAGGGGHFAPALAVIEALPKDVEVMIVGRQYVFEADKTESLEYQTAKKLGLPFTPLTTGRYQRKLTRHSLLSLMKIPVGFLQAQKLLKTYQPDVVLSFGGYVSVPVVLAAASLKLPIVIHEQILHAGLANKIAAPFARKICISWDESKKYFPAAKVVLTGNPIRKQQTAAFPLPEEKKPIIYITGGSGGSHAINMLVEQCIEKLLHKYIVIHQTGDAKEFGDFNRLQAVKNTLPPQAQKRYILTKFVDPSAVFAILEKADLVVARSGMSTVTEILAHGTPALFIPLPYGQHNEQLTNAQFVKKIGLAEILEQKNLTGDLLDAAIVKMLAQLSKYKVHKASAQKLVDPQAAQKVIAVLTDVSN